MIYNKEIIHFSHLNTSSSLSTKRFRSSAMGARRPAMGAATSKGGARGCCRGWRPGFGKKGYAPGYKCELCDFDLHKSCALPAQSISHPFYPKCKFQFFTKAPGSGSRYCNACGKDVVGFVYHCNLCGFDLHPCCYNLPHMLDDGELKLFLYPKVSSPCHRCGRKGPSWSYGSRCKKYHLHVSCVKDMLAENWQDLYYSDGKRSSDLYTRIPSLKGTGQNHHRSQGGNKVRRCCEVAGMAVQFIISAVLGDPTAIIAGVIGSLISKA